MASDIIKVSRQGQKENCICVQFLFIHAAILGRCGIFFKCSRDKHGGIRSTHIMMVAEFNVTTRPGHSADLHRGIAIFLKGPKSILWGWDMGKEIDISTEGSFGELVLGCWMPGANIRPRLILRQTQSWRRSLTDNSRQEN